MKGENMKRICHTTDYQEHKFLIKYESTFFQNRYTDIISTYKVHMIISYVTSWQLLVYKITRSVNMISRHTNSTQISSWQ